ncbi:MAG: FtsX-like permease family protein [Bacteroidales bacterium]
MRVSLFIARRYLFSLRSLGISTVVSLIAVLGVTVTTAALFCTLSVFNGFGDLVKSLYTAFDSEIKITPKTGKYISAADPTLQKMKSAEGVAVVSESIEDAALILFTGRPAVITLKGVDGNYDRCPPLPPPPHRRNRLPAANEDTGIPGKGLAGMMGTVDYGTLEICVPRRGEQVNLANPAESFNVGTLASPGVCFDDNQKKYDDSYLLTSLEFAQELLEQPGNITQLELKLADGADAAAVKRKLKEIGGDKFEVLDRLEQQGEMYRMMQIEKLMAYIFLSLILVIATFNVVSTLSLLMVQKREDLQTIACLGGDGKTLRGIFLNVGRMICLIGGLLGTGLGALLCYIQQEYGIIRLGQSSGTFIIDYYPVSVHPTDVILVLLTVVGLGFLSVRIAVHRRFR